MTDIKPATPQDAYDLWKDKMIYGNAYMDSDGKRIDAQEPKFRRIEYVRTGPLGQEHVTEDFELD